MLSDSKITEHTRIPLVEPQDSLNVGSVARAMKNLGFKHLCLVRPKSFSLEKALVTGRWAEDLLRAAVIYDSLTEALAPMKDVIGFSSHTRPNRGEPIPLPDWTAETTQRPLEKTALLFGREDTGLPVEAIEQCRILVRIPSRAEYPAFNLAQSALIVMYELSRLQWGTISQDETESPSWNQFEQLDRICQAVMALSGFHHCAEGDPTALVVKNMFRRTRMSEREMRVILALFNRVRVSLARESQLPNPE